MRTLSSVALAVMFAVAAPAAGPGTLSPERVARIDKVLQQYVDENRIAGAVGYVLQDGKPIYERAVGWADKEAGTRMAPNTIFRIASQTKAITSAAILSLMEEGKLNLTDPVSRYIPSFASSKVAVRKRDRRRDRAGEAADPDSRSADAYRRHLVRHRSVRRRGCIRPRASGPRPGTAGSPPTRTNRFA